LLHCNPDEAAVVYSRFPRSDWINRYRIGYWAYELPRAPQRWIDFARAFHEVWVPSAFVADALAGSETIVRVMPHPPPNWPVREPPHRPSSVVRFLSFADMRSSAARKNPLGVVKAFLLAFPSSSNRVELMVKIVGGDFDRDSRRTLFELCAERSDITVLEKDYSDDALAGLMAEADVFVSLHRAEGFGLAILEAMTLERAVLATGWSGNLAFMTDFTDALVPYALTSVIDPTGAYPSGSMLWAEPDLIAAAAKMRALAADPQLRSAIAKEARRRATGLSAHWTRQALAAMPLHRAAAQRDPTG
jgi:glycosyltransferase involved in cell wall biosynthesis